MIDPELQRWANQRVQQLEDEGRILLAILLNLLVVLGLDYLF